MLHGSTGLVEMDYNVLQLNTYSSPILCSGTPPFTSEDPSPGALMLDVPQPWEVCSTLLTQAVYVISEAWGISKSVSPLPSWVFPGD